MNLRKAYVDRGAADFVDCEEERRNSPSGELDAICSSGIVQGAYAKRRAIAEVEHAAKNAMSIH